MPDTVHTLDQGDAALSMPIGVTYPEIREAVRKLCEKFPGTYWQEKDRERAYPTEFVKELTESGFLAVLIPEEYGGAGLPISAGSAILEEINGAGCNAGACHAQMYIMGTVLRHGSEEQKKQYLPKIATGELRLQAFGVTEPTSGTDTLALRTTAVKEGNEYVVNGQKVWTSRAEHSDLLLLLARTTPRDKVTKRTDGLSVFLVDMRKVLGKGLTIRPIRAMVNHSTTELFFDNMRIPADSLIGEAVQFPISECWAATQAAELMVRKACALFEAGQPCGAEANTAKYLAAEASWKGADVCMQTFGGFAFAEEYDVERKFREARLYRTAPISSNLILGFIGEHVLGMPRSY